MSDRPVARPRLLTPSFASLLVAQACFGYAFSSFFLLPKYLVVALGAGPAEIGLVTAAHGVGVVLFMPLMGVLVDRHGRRDFLTLGALLMAAASFGFAGVDSVGPLIYALRAIQALAFAMAFAAGAALAVDEAPPERVAQAIGVFGLTFLSMNFVAPAAVEEIAARAGWSTAFATPGFAALACALLSRRVRDRRPPPGDGDAVPGLLEVAFRARQIRAMAVIALVGTAMCAVFVYHQPFALERGFTRLRAFFLAYAACAVAVRVFFGHLMDEIGHRRVSIASLALYVVVVGSVPELDVIGLAPIGAGLGLAHGIFYPAFNALAVGAAGENERGKVMALFQAGFHVGFSGGGLALGLLAERAGYPAVFQAGGACVLVALGVLVAWPDGRRGREAGGSDPAAPRGAPGRELR